MMRTPNYTPNKRDEMTFGYLSQGIAELDFELVPDLSGSVKLYSDEEMFEIMTKLDAYFMGARRSTIDKLAHVRQAILYTLVTRTVDGVRQFAVYRRGNGADARLEGNFSIGFGGHVEVEDIWCHNQSNGAQPHAVSSYRSILASGMREMPEEVLLTSETRGQVANYYAITPRGFISDVKPYLDHVGNTHIGIIGVFEVPADTEYEILETKYSKVSWMSAEELRQEATAERLEPWSKLLLPHLDQL